MVARIDQLKSYLKGGGTRPNLFSLNLATPSGVNNLLEGDQILVKAANLPGSTIGEVEIPFMGRKLTVAGDREFDTWELTVIADVNFKVRDTIERWHNLISEEHENSGTTNPGDYMADQLVHQLNKQEQKIMTYRLLNAWPTTLAPIDVGYDNENTIEEFSITFRYTHYRRENIGQGGGSSIGSGLSLPVGVDLGP